MGVKRKAVGEGLGTFFDVIGQIFSLFGQIDDGHKKHKKHK